MWGARLLFGEEGVAMLAAHGLRQGEWLYRDLAYQYGPLPAFGYAAAARIGGNGPATYIACIAVLGSMGVGVLSLSVARATDTSTARFVTILGLLPLMIVPGAVMGGYVNSPYVVMERILLAVLACCWRRPDERSTARAALTGTLLGTWQLVRFGGAVAAGGALLIVDAIVLACYHADAATWRRWIRGLIVTVACFAGVEAAWIGIALALLPGPIARDALWPAYILQAYTWVTPGMRWPHWAGWPAFFAQYLLPLSAGCLGITGLVGLARRTLRDRSSDVLGRAAGLFVPLVFFMFGMAFLFRSDAHYRQFAWALVPAAAVAIAPMTLRWRTIVAAIWLPAAVPLMTPWIHRAIGDTPPRIWKSLPNGQKIIVEPGEVARVEFLAGVAGLAHGRPVLFMPNGSGWHAVYDVPHATRHTSFYSPYVVRPYERTGFVAAAQRAAAIVHCPDSPGQPVPLDDDLKRQILRSFHLWETRAGCAVYLSGPSP
jgi:hypothetical protein